MAGKLSGDGDMREGALRNKTLYNFIFPLSTVGWSGSGMGVGRGRPKLLRWGEGGRCAIKLCTILFFHVYTRTTTRQSGRGAPAQPVKRPRRAMPRTARSAVLGFERLRLTVSTVQPKTHNLWVQAEGGPAPKPGPRTKGNPKPSCARQILFAAISSQNAPTGRLARTPATVCTKIAAERACVRLRANANTLQIDGQRACGA